MACEAVQKAEAGEKGSKRARTLSEGGGGGGCKSKKQ